MFTSASSTTLNSYGYSPHPLKSYINWVFTLLTTPTSAGQLANKPVIISITAAKPHDLEEMVAAIQELRTRVRATRTSQATDRTTDGVELIAVELNTSCPNIKNAPPPSYDLPSLNPFLLVLAAAYYADPTLTIGLKLPPYLYATCFHDAISAISAFSWSDGNPFAFITCTNTLGSSLLYTDQLSLAPPTDIVPALPTPLGGLGGDAIHPIALGNVYTFAQLLSAHSDEAMRRVVVIGVGGVTSAAAAGRMFKAGAKVVECATLLGQQGIIAFSAILKKDM